MADLTLEPIHVAVATDEKYWHHAAVMLLSLIRHHDGPEKIVCHLINSGLSSDQKNEFIDFFHPQGLSIDWLTVDPGLFKDFPLAEYFTLAAYYRIQVPELISDSVKKVIYLDSDTFLLDDISELWQLDINGMPVAAAENFHSFHKEFVGIPAESKFFNSGVMIIDLEYWRRHNISQKLRQIVLTRREKMIYCDQEALNILLHDKCFFLPPKWNYCHQHEDVIRLFDLDSLRPGMKEAVERPSLVHFITGLKPDNFDDFSSFADLYRSYAGQIPFLKGRIGRPSLSQMARKSVFRFRRFLLPFWFKRFYFRMNPGKLRMYWPGLPDWYW